MNKALEIYKENFPMETHFERAIFISWYCARPTCKFCYMHGIKDKIKDPKKARRRLSSIFAETLITKICNWEIGFVSGGIHSWSIDELKEVLEGIKKITGKKQWLNIGVLNEYQIKSLLPYTYGLTGTVECVHNRDHIVPDKPLDKIEEMFKLCDKYGLKKTITFIIGLGENIDDFPKLASLIQKWKIDRINFYRLVPHDNTEFNKNGPSSEYYAEWISRTRIAFPKIDIVAGSWADKMQEVSLLLDSGANSITKLPALKYFGKLASKQIEKGAEKAGRKFKSHMTKYPKVDIDKIIDRLDFDNDMKTKIKNKYMKYYSRLKKFE